jgi:lysophospholipase L1-like esterase
MALRFLITLTSTIITLFVFEVTLRIGGYMPQYALKFKTLEGKWSILRITLDEQRLYRVVPGSRVDINSAGFRDKEFHKKVEGVKRIVVLGDSFVMANNLEPHETYPSKLATFLGTTHEVLNLGVSGYGPDQALEVLRDDVPDLEPDIVVLTIFAGNDFSDLAKNGLYKLNEAGELTRIRENLVTKAVPLIRTKMLFRVLFARRYLPQEVEKEISAAFIEDKVILHQPDSELAKREQSLLRQLLLLFSKEVKQLGANFRVVIFPSLEALEDTAATFVNEELALSACREAELHCIDVRDDVLTHGGIELYDPDYQHFNAQGARVVAQSVAQALRK